MHFERLMVVCYGPGLLRDRLLEASAHVGEASLKLGDPRPAVIAQDWPLAGISVRKPSPEQTPYEFRRMSKQNDRPKIMLLGQIFSHQTSRWILD